jgi:CHAT domain
MVPSMSSSQYLRHLEAKRRQRVDAERRAGDFRGKEADKRAAATKAVELASRTTSASMAASRLREAGRRESEANAAGKEAARWQRRAADYAKEEAALQAKLAKAEQREGDEAERRRKRDQQAADRRDAAERASFHERLDATETLIGTALRELRAPKPEKLRILMLAASSEGDLRVGREQTRIRRAVERALHRDLIQLEGRPSATAEDLLDGISGFRPHIVHFSGHSGNDVIVFEQKFDERHPGVAVSAQAFAHAVAATDTPPLLVVLNSCNSASQLEHLVERVVPFAIGMSDEIADGDAIIYAARFYAGVADGQSVQSAHQLGRAALEMAGLAGRDLPTLAHAPDVDPAETILVVPPK